MKELFLLTALIGVCSATTFGQAPNYILFELSSELRTSSLDTVLTDYLLLQPQTNNWRQIMRDQPEALEITLPGPDGLPLKAQLNQASIFAEEFTLCFPDGSTQAPFSNGLHYRGHLEDQQGSLVAFSIFEDQIMASISTPELGTMTVGPVQVDQNTGAYLLYQNSSLRNRQNFFCFTEDSLIPYPPEQINGEFGEASEDICVNLYLEVDYDIFQDKGGTQGTTNFITGLFNQVAALYAADDLSIKLSELFLWDRPSPYDAPDSFSILRQFQSQRRNFNGDLGQLISYKASGGIAILSGLCRTNTSSKLSFSSIRETFSFIPNYSWSVMVIAHEFGHLFGSQHTHACVWNGNNTAIDGCAGYTEGSCGLAPTPLDGGTVMSYCHLRSTGINFTKGFGLQPSSIMQFNVVNANCLAVCAIDDSADEEDCAPLTVEITLDNFGNETTWEITAKNGASVLSGGPYEIKSAGATLTDVVCLESGCYTFEIKDSYGDGMCCAFGQGGYLLRSAEGEVITSGGDFFNAEGVQICVETDGGGTQSDCGKIEFESATIEPYGGFQDRGSFSLEENNEVLQLENNAWKAIPSDYVVTSDAQLIFEFRSTLEGEIHGIGFDTDNSISSNRTFKVHGTQSWGILDFDTYSGNGEWQTFTIPVGEYYTGTFSKLFFTADHDFGARNGNAFFRNVRFFKTGQCSAIEADLADLEVLPPSRDEGPSISPNPAQEMANLNFKAPAKQEARINVFDSQGRLQATHQVAGQGNWTSFSLPLDQLPNGLYIVQIQTANHRQNLKLMVLH